jgi:amidase
MNDIAAQNSLGAFMPGPQTRIEGKAGGPLSGLTLAVKDLYDVAGERTGAGNPDWMAKHPPAARHAWAVQALLDAGATSVGRTITVELAFGMSGDNIHYGMPVNPAAPERVPGGSSSGSASAVAGKLADIALGSDTGGSIRIPASYCGIYGLRPTHGRVSLAGVVPLSSSFDTAGPFARDARTLERAARVLLGETGTPPTPTRLLWPEDVFGHAEARTVTAIMPLADKLAGRVGVPEKMRVHNASLDEWAQDFRTLMAREAWLTHRAWIENDKPHMAADVATRFRIASRVTDAEVAAATPRREAITAHMQQLLAGNAVMVLPTSPGPAPRKDSPTEELELARFHAHALCCISGLARLPQLTIPFGKVDGAPVGLSLMGAQGTDAMLLRLATELTS